MSLLTRLSIARSANGRWRVEATAIEQRNWATEVTCTLFDHGRLVWSQKNLSRDPVGGIRVADDGWFVILTWG